MEKLEPVDHARLFALKLKKNRLARLASMGTVRFSKITNSWTARVGGAVKGRTISARTRDEVEAQVTEYYNAQMAEANAAMVRRAK